MNRLVLIRMCRCLEGWGEGDKICLEVLASRRWLAQVGDEGEDQEDDEANLCHPSCSSGKAPESEHTCDKGDNEEDNGVVEHISGLLL